jgi:hypothetical protein
MLMAANNYSSSSDNTSGDSFVKVEARERLPHQKPRLRLSCKET